VSDLDPGRREEASSRRSRVASLAGTTVANFAVGVLGFAGSVMSTRLLGPSGRGDLAIIQTIPTLTGIVAMLGMPDAAVYRVAAEREHSKTIVTTAALVCSAASLVIGTVLFFLAPLVTSDETAHLVSAFRVYLLLLLVVGVYWTLTQPLRAVDRYVAWNVTRVAQTASWTFVVGLGTVFGWRTAQRLTTAHLVVLALLLPCAILLARRAYQGRAAFSLPLARGMLRFGVPTALSSIPQLANYRLDQAVLLFFVTRSELGVYATAFGWSYITTPVLQTIGAVCLPRLASTVDTSLKRDELARVVRIGFGATIVVAGGGAAVTPLLVPFIFGSSFGPFVGVFAVMVLAMSVNGLNYILEESTKGMNRPRTVLYAEIGGLVALGIFFPVMTTHFRIMGAAVTSCLTYCAVTVSLLVSIRRHERIPLRRLLTPRIADVRSFIAGLPAAPERFIHNTAG